MVDTQNVYTVKKYNAVKIIDVLRLIADSVKMLQLSELLGKDQLESMTDYSFKAPITLLNISKNFR